MIIFVAMYDIIKSFLFRKEPEAAHYFVMNNLKRWKNFPLVQTLLQSTLQTSSNQKPIHVMGLDFINPVGIAAGFDKNAEYIEELALLGFGYVEIGTVTPLPQPGNPAPRLMRLRKDKALINRMGFNNNGVDYAVEQLKKTKRNRLIVGGNIGKNKITPNDKAVEDYLICFRKLFDYVDYFVVNVSSPNTPGLRELQEKEPLLYILQTLQKENEQKNKPKPILLKIAPDLSTDQLDDIIEIVEQANIAGIVATNTTLSRDGLVSEQELTQEIGGLSGRPLMEKSTEILQYLHTKIQKDKVLIGVGGIHTAKDAICKQEAGASLVQLYTGFIYEGPQLIQSIKKAWISTQK